MPRPNRDSGINGIYHVYQRGNNKEYLLKTDDAKSFFINQVKQYKKKFDFEILSYVIMDNHYHIIIKTNKDPLDEIMFNINNVFVKYLNKQLSRTGHVFETRYKCKRIETDANLIWLLRYVHRNPVRAKIVENIDNYFWSSHNCYKTGNKDFVNCLFILCILSKSRNNAIKKYLTLVKSNGDGTNETYDFELIKDTIFKEWNIEDTSYNPQFSRINNLAQRESLDGIGDRCFMEKEIKSLVVKGNKRRDLTPLKLQFIEEALNLKYTLKEIAKYLNTYESSISQLKSRHNGKLEINNKV